MFGTQDIIIIGIIVVILFGAKRLPEIGKGLGQAIGGFKKSLHEPEEIEATPKKNTSEKK
jgi:sec-independent protein translocase protein TatA